jgi:hypothetical protein
MEANMKKFLLFAFSLMFLFACGSKHELLPTPQKMDEKQALSVLEKFMAKQFNEKGYSYYKTIPNLKQGRIVFSWKNENLNKYFIRYFIVSGNNRYVELVDKGGEYVVSIKNASLIVNCYGYSHKLPKIYDPELKTNFEIFSQNDCRNAIRLITKDRKEAEDVAAALTSIFSIQDQDDKEDDKQAEKSELKSENSSKEKNTKCSVDKILKMKEIGLTADEIKKICE